MHPLDGKCGPDYGLSMLGRRGPISHFEPESPDGTVNIPQGCWRRVPGRQLCGVGVFPVSCLLHVLYTPYIDTCVS